MYEYKIKLEKASKREFMDDQRFEAILGFENELSREQVAFYYKTEYTQEQMEQARFAFVDGLTMEQVAVFYRPEYTGEQMDIARYMFYEGRTVKEVKNMLEEAAADKKQLQAEAAAQMSALDRAIEDALDERGTDTDNELDKVRRRAYGKRR